MLARSVMRLLMLTFGITNPNPQSKLERVPISSLHSRYEMDLTGFMFGNINEDGELENDELIDKVRIRLPWYTFI